MWIFGRQLFYKLLAQGEFADLRIISNQLNLESTEHFEDENKKKEKIYKIVDSRILFEMFRIFDSNARFFVCSFYSDILTKIMGIGKGTNNQIRMFLSINSKMNIAFNVSVRYEENLEEWNLKGQLRICILQKKHCDKFLANKFV